MSESALLATIVERLLLTYRGRVLVLRVNCGTMRGYRGHAVKWSVCPGEWEVDGVADLLLGVRQLYDDWNSREPEQTMRLVAIEVKDPGGKTSPKRREAQQRFRNEINGMGGYAVQVDSVSAAVEHVRRAMCGGMAW